VTFLFGTLSSEEAKRIAEIRDLFYKKMKWEHKHQQITTQVNKYIICHLWGVSLMSPTFAPRGDQRIQYLYFLEKTGFKDSVCMGRTWWREQNQFWDHRTWSPEVSLSLRWWYRRNGVWAQAKGGSEILGLQQARNLKGVGLIVFFTISAANHVCLSYTVLSLLTIDVFVSSF
jgi:hypothetical protein